MSGSGISRANANRQIRQEAIRDQLQAGGHIQHIVDIAKQLSDLDSPMEQLAVTRLKNAADIKLALLKKYLPDLKQVEIEGGIEHSGGLTITWQK